MWVSHDFDWFNDFDFCYQIRIRIIDTDPDGQYDADPHHRFGKKTSLFIIIKDEGWKKWPNIRVKQTNTVAGRAGQYPGFEYSGPFLEYLGHF